MNRYTSVAVVLAAALACGAQPAIAQYAQEFTRGPSAASRQDVSVDCR